MTLVLYIKLKPKIWRKKEGMDFNAIINQKSIRVGGWKQVVEHTLSWITSGSELCNYVSQFFTKLLHSVQFLTIRQGQRRIRSPSYKTLVAAKLGLFFVFLQNHLFRQNSFMQGG